MKIEKRRSERLIELIKKKSAKNVTTGRLKEVVNECTQWMELKTSSFEIWLITFLIDDLSFGRFSNCCLAEWSGSRMEVNIYMRTRNVWIEMNMEDATSTCTFTQSYSSRKYPEGKSSNFFITLLPKYECEVALVIT